MALAHRNGDFSRDWQYPSRPNGHRRELPEQQEDVPGLGHGAGGGRSHKPVWQRVGTPRPQSPAQRQAERTPPKAACFAGFSPLDGALALAVAPAPAAEPPCAPLGAAFPAGPPLLLWRKACSHRRVPLRARPGPSAGLVTSAFSSARRAEAASRARGDSGWQPLALP